VVSFTSWPLYRREIPAGIHWIGSWAGPRAGLDIDQWKFTDKS